MFLKRLKEELKTDVRIYKKQFIEKRKDENLIEKNKRGKL